MAAAYSFEPVDGKSAAVQVADIVAEPVPVAVADMPVPFAEPVVEPLAAGTSVELLVADLLGQAVAPSF